MLVASLIGVPAGVISAIRQDRWIDYVMRMLSLAGLSMPSFWLGMVIILVLVWSLGWIPALTYISPFEDLKAHVLQFLFPALAVGYRSSALIMRITRSSLLEVMREDYIRTAYAKGQRERVVIWRHALKNAFLPVITVLGIEFAFLVGGLVVTETVFNLPGVARFLVEAILWRDYPVVQNLVMFIAVVVILVNLAVDMLYGWLDPRVRYALRGCEAVSCLETGAVEGQRLEPAPSAGQSTVAIRAAEAPGRGGRHRSSCHDRHGALRGQSWPLRDPVRTDAAHTLSPPAARTGSGPTTWDGTSTAGSSTGRGSP